MRRGQVVAGVVALVFVFGPAFGYVVGFRQAPVDNRAIAPPPAASAGWDAFDAVGPWASDRLAGRSTAVRGKSWFDFHVLQELPASGKVVRGPNGYLFLGEDFTKACKQTPGFRQGLDGLAALADVIERSGRKVVITAGPNKSSVVEPPAVVPEGQCALDGIASQNATLDAFEHPAWLGLREKLTKSQTYWKTDSHWSGAGAAVFAQELAKKLGVTAPVRTTPDQVTKTADLNVLLGLTGTETPPSLQVSTGTTVTPQPGFAAYDPTKVLYGVERWKTTPATGLVGGKSVIIGDSFSYFALGNLRPLFADGTFLWTGHVSEAELIAAIKGADTVVLQIVQRSITPGHAFATKAFRDKVAAALR
ncbi:alginate O-acetyltransferase AlgX-related protein [Kribbella endophytica]